MQMKNSSSSEEPAIAAIILKTVSLALFMILGSYGNFRTVYSIWCDQRMQVALNIFIASVCLVDLAMCTLIMPFALISIAHGQWIFGEVFCKIHFTFMVYLAQVTVLFVATIIFERYLSICRRRYPSFSRSSTIALVLAIFILPIPFSFPYYRQNIVFFPSTGMCFNAHTLRNYEEMCIFAADTAILKCIPLLIDFFALWRIGAVLHRLRRRVGPGILSNEDKLTANAHARSAGTSLAFLLSYLGLDLPLYIALVVHRHSVFRGQPGISGNSRAACLWLFWLECAIKPVIYALRKQHRATRVERRFPEERVRNTRNAHCIYRVEHGHEEGTQIENCIPLGPRSSFPILAFGDFTNLSSIEKEEAARGANNRPSTPPSTAIQGHSVRRASTDHEANSKSEHKLTAALLRSIANRYEVPQGGDLESSAGPNSNEICDIEMELITLEEDGRQRALCCEDIDESRV